MSDPLSACRPLLVSARKAAALIDVSASTWARLQAAGKIPRPIKLTGGTVRWRIDDLRAWAAAGCPNRKRFEELRNAETAG